MDRGTYQTGDDDKRTAVQGGPARLRDALESVYAEWLSLSRPPRAAFGLTVTPTGEHFVWHDSPDGPRWTL